MNHRTSPLGARPAALALRIALGVALLLGAASCSSEEPFLDVRAPQTCAGVLFAVWGAACNFPQVCVDVEEHVRPDDPSCCTSYAECPNGQLIIDYHCNSPCQGCRDDSECTAGADVCSGKGRCVPCPLETRCEPCEQGQVRVMRNGCSMCECTSP